LFKISDFILGGKAIVTEMGRESERVIERVETI